jgi:hypothetical protein
MLLGSTKWCSFLPSAQRRPECPQLTAGVCLVSVSRGSTHSLPTVIEDDIFGACGGLELGLESQLAEQAGAAAAGLRAEGPHAAGELPRGLIVRNVPITASDEELRQIFSVSGLSYVGRCMSTSTACGLLLQQPIIMVSGYS